MIKLSLTFTLCLVILVFTKTNTLRKQLRKAFVWLAVIEGVVHDNTDPLLLGLWKGNTTHQGGKCVAEQNCSTHGEPDCKRVEEGAIPMR